MSTLAVAPSLFEPLGGQPTLDELLVSAWDGLAAHRVVACLVCHGELDPEYSAHPRPIGGRCSDCGSTLR